MLATLIASVTLGARANARDDAYRVIYDFQGSADGWEPVGVLAVAKDGDLYGVTEAGGTYNLGTIFKLTAPRSRVGPWTKTVLYDCPGGNGGVSPASVVIGKGGNLYGVDSSQTIFELSLPTSYSSPWNYTVLFTLNGNSDGANITGNLVFDAKGNLYGVTELGGDPSCGQEGGCGTIFKLKRPTKNGGKWGFSVLYTFAGTPDGAEPFAGVTFDQNGNLYGTTHSGGTFSYGTAYRLTPPARKGRPWRETVLYSFDRSENNGNSPAGPVLFDSSGNIYGTTPAGGDPNCQGGLGCGVVYELSPPAKDGKVWTYTTLYAFQGGDDGITPTGYIVFDSAGNLYGTTQSGGGETNGGTVYRLKPPVHSDGAWTETVLHGFIFGNGDGALPNGVTWGKWRELYGLTFEGGLCQYCGTAFELQP
jgi:uncharacterized repeat protein (TIGR03803 family)